MWQNETNLSVTQLVTTLDPQSKGQRFEFLPLPDGSKNLRSNDGNKKIYLGKASKLLVLILTSV